MKCEDCKALVALVFDSSVRVAGKRKYKSSMVIGKLENVEMNCFTLPWCQLHELPVDPLVERQCNGFIVDDRDWE